METTTANETKHTATPWRYLDGAILSQDLNTSGNWIVNELPKRELKNGYYDSAEDQANAAFIVQACNSHDKLVRDNAVLLKALKELLREFVPSRDKFVRIEQATALTVALAIIAQAEKESD